MHISSTLEWLRSRRLVIAIAALALALSLAFASGNSWTTNAASEAPADVVVDDDMTLAGPSWTFSRSVAPPSCFGPSWG